MKKNIFKISIFIIIFDQLIKIIVNNFLNERITIIDNFFYLHKHFNEGAAFSILSGQRIVLIILSFIILVFMVKYIDNFKVNLRNTFAFGLIIGGLIGNLIDRIVLGYVIDYLKFILVDYHFPIFNIADMSICIGIGLLIIAVLKKEDINEISSK